MDRNVFGKPEEQSEACFSYALARKRLTKLNVFDKPKEQSEARFGYALARKRLTKYIIYIYRYNCLYCKINGTYNIIL